MGHTANAADAFIRRQSMWNRLIGLFKSERPSEEQMGRVSTIAEVAIDQVWTAYNLPQERCVELHPLVKDYADAAALYGYVLGLAEARQEYAARARALAS